MAPGLRVWGLESLVLGVGGLQSLVLRVETLGSRKFRGSMQEFAEMGKHTQGPLRREKHRDSS